MRRRIAGEGGANAVEFALILPLLVMLIFGGITAGLALNARQQIDHAGREGVRYAATLLGATDATSTPCGGSNSWHECVRDRVVATSVGSIASGNVCVSYVPESGAPTPADILDPAGLAEATNQCVAESPPLTGARVQVKAIAPNRVNAVFVKTPVFNLTTRSIARYESE